MLTDAFEEAFYQLDQDRDGVVTVQDLERYSREKNLKDKFIQKWLNLFADDKSVIYYDKFCSTLGIVPAPEKFEHKIYKIDMTNETQKSITDIISNFCGKDDQLSKDTLEKIKGQVGNKNGGQWQITLNPNNDDLNVKYDENGMLYYSPSSKKDMKILIWKVPSDLDKKFQNKIHQIDMTDETQQSIINIIDELQEIDNSFSPKTLDEIKTRISNENGGQWNVIVDPDSSDFDVEYDEDGLLFYNPNILEDINVLVYRVTVDKENELPYKIHQMDMTEKTKKSVTDTISEFLSKDKNLSKNTLDQIKNEISNGNGGKWEIKLKPNNNDLEVKYDEDGLLCYSPNKSDDLKILVWKIPTELKKEHDSKIYQIDMTEKTKSSIIEIIDEFQNKDEDLSKKNLEDIKKHIANKNGGQWDVKLKPDSKDLAVKYDEDGLLCYSPNKSDDLKILIWKVSKKLEYNSGNDIIYDCDMSETIKNEVLQLVHDKTKDNVIETESIILKLDEKFGKSWNLQLNPTTKQLKVDYDLDGKIYFSPNTHEEPKIFIWRQDKDKKRGGLCCGCF